MAKADYSMVFQHDRAFAARLTVWVDNNTPRRRLIKLPDPNPKHLEVKRGSRA